MISMAMPVYTESRVLEESSTNSDDYRTTECIAVWIRQRADRFTNPRKDGEMLKDMRRRRVIEESDRPWSSPVILVWKKDGNMHFCTDYRKLDDITRNDFPSSRIDNTLDTLAGAKWFTTLDMKSGFSKWIYNRTTRIWPPSRQVKGYGRTQSCSLASATLLRHLRG
jgi:hypothetical protein